MKERIIIYGLLALLVLAVSSAMYAWYKKPSTITQTEWSKPKEIIKEKRVSVPGPEKVVTIEKEVIVTKLKLPDWFKNDANEQAIATALIEPYKGKTNAVAVLNTKTGVGQIIAKQEPLALFGFVNDKEIGVRAGVNIKGEQETTVYGKWSFVRVGNVHVGVYGDANSTGTAKVQLEAGFRF